MLLMEQFGIDHSDPIIVLDLGGGNFSLIRGVHQLCAIQLFDPNVTNVRVQVIQAKISHKELASTIGFFAKEGKERTPFTFVEQVNFSVL